MTSSSRIPPLGDASVGARTGARARAEGISNPRRRSVLGALLALGFGRLFTSGVAAAKAPPQAFRVIVHPENPHLTLSRHVIADMFLKKVTRWEDGQAVHAYDQRADADVRRKFSDAILQRSVAAVRHYWQQRIFSGRDVPPPELESDDAVLRRVQGDRSAIGYVSERATLTAVAVVRVT